MQQAKPKKLHEKYSTKQPVSAGLKELPESLSNEYEIAERRK